MRYQVTAYITVDDDMPIEAVQEWVAYHLGSDVTVAQDNPLRAPPLNTETSEVKTSWH